MGRRSVTLLTTTDTEGWQDTRHLLQAHGLDDVYYHPEYISLYAGEDSRVEGFLYQDSGETFFFPYIKRRVLNTPPELCDFETAYGYGGPVATSQETDFLDAAWEAFLDYGRGCGIFAGLIRFHPLLKNQTFATPSWIERQFVRQTVMVTLDCQEDNVWGGYRPDTRKSINRAERNRVEIEQHQGTDALLQFAELYNQTMNDVGAAESYRFGSGYFQRIGQGLDGNYNVFLAHYDSKTVGGVLTLNGDRLVHLHLSATDRGTRHLGTASLLRHTAIMANLRKKSAFHFGGGMTNQPDDTLLHFKQGFSKERSEYHIGKVTVDPVIYREVCAKWEDANPDKNASHRSMFLKYRL